jgi:hypothetical protein
MTERSGYGIARLALATRPISSKKGPGSMLAGTHTSVQSAHRDCPCVAKQPSGGRRRYPQRRRPLPVCPLRIDHSPPTHLVSSAFTELCAASTTRKSVAVGGESNFPPERIRPGSLPQGRAVMTASRTAPCSLKRRLPARPEQQLSSAKPLQPGHRLAQTHPAACQDDLALVRRHPEQERQQGGDDAGHPAAKVIHDACFGQPSRAERATRRAWPMPGWRRRRSCHRRPSGTTRSI